MIEAVKQNGILLEYASFELRNDKELVLIAVTQTGLSYKYASQELQLDKDVILTASKTYPTLVQNLPKDLIDSHRDIFMFFHKRWDIMKPGIDQLHNFNFYFQ